MTYKSNTEVVKLLIIVLVCSVDKSDIASLFVQNCVRLATFARGLAFAGRRGNTLAAPLGRTLTLHLEGFGSFCAGLGLCLGFTGSGLGSRLSWGFLLSGLC